MIKITVFLAQSLVKDGLVLKERNVVIVDVLRATTTMITALANGAKDIVPAETVPVAARVAKGSSNSVLCGERNGKLIEGFAMGNSPFEYTEQAVKGKSLVFCTTNGTQAIAKARHAKSCILAGIINLDKVVSYLKELNEDFTILCSGKLNNFCTEDAVAAGLIIKNLIESGSRNEYELNDPEYVSLMLAKSLGTKSGKASEEKLLETFMECEHGKYLQSLGFVGDLAFAAKLNSHPLIPVFKNGVIKLKEVFEQEADEKARMKRVNISNKAGKN